MSLIQVSSKAPGARATALLIVWMGVVLLLVASVA